MHQFPCFSGENGCMHGIFNGQPAISFVKRDKGAVRKFSRLYDPSS